MDYIIYNLDFCFRFCLEMVLVMIYIRNFEGLMIGCIYGVLVVRFEWFKIWLKFGWNWIIIYLINIIL